MKNERCSSDRYIRTRTRLDYREKVQTTALPTRPFVVLTRDTYCDKGKKSQSAVAYAMINPQLFTVKASTRRPSPHPPCPCGHPSCGPSSWGRPSFPRASFLPQPLPRQKLLPLLQRALRPLPRGRLRGRRRPLLLGRPLGMRMPRGKRRPRPRRMPLALPTPLDRGRHHA